MKEIFRFPYILVFLLLGIGAGSYFYLSQGGKSVERVDYNTYLPGKVFVSFYGSGMEKGTFYSDGTYQKITTLEFVPNDTRSNQYEGTWSSGPTSITLDAGSDHEIVIQTIALRLHEETVLVEESLAAGDGGYVIGESLNSIFQYIQTSAPQWSSEEKSAIELAPNRR